MTIRVQHLSRSYGTQKAIDDISFEIGKSEIVGFLGPNGAGKTTTMKILTCFMQPDEGRVEFGEYNIFSHPVEIKRRTGYLPEHNPLYPDMYVKEFLRFAGSLHGMKGKDLSDRISSTIEKTGLGREQQKKIGMLSKGYRQRVGLAQALLHDPMFLILDEPTTGLDPNQIVEIRNLIREIGKEKTVLFSTHILPEVEAIAGRVIIIHRGRIMADDKLENLSAGESGEQVLQVEFENEGFDSGLLKSENIQSEKTGPKSFVFRSATHSDFRKRLLEESIRQENGIERLVKAERSLEEVFRKLTKETNPQ